jgi:cell division protease FtsH
VLKKNKKGHEKLADLLLEREVIFSEDLETIFGKRPWDKKHVIPENGNSEPEKNIAENVGSWDDTKKEIPENKTTKS